MRTRRRVIFMQEVLSLVGFIVLVQWALLGLGFVGLILTCRRKRNRW